MACRAGKMYSARTMWRILSKALGMGDWMKGTKQHAKTHLHPLLQGVPQHASFAFVLTDNECPVPWINFGTPSVPFIKITDHSPGRFDVVAPFVLSRPPWLVDPAGSWPRPRTVPWNDRKLLFFAGHVPKLYIKPIRYKIWRQIRRWPNVTAISATINCTIGGMSVCPQVLSCVVPSELPCSRIARNRLHHRHSADR